MDTKEIQNAEYKSNKFNYLFKDIVSKKKLSFKDFNLKKEILQGILDLGFIHPSPIQEESIPKILSGKDVIARAKNGTGKTAAYIIPILQKITPETSWVQSLILVPTRELALQISCVTKNIGKYISNLKIMVTTGGTVIREDIIRMYQFIHILIGTPGRILDLLLKKIIKSLECKMLVLDEADKLLSDEFFSVISGINKLFSCKNKQTILFSATFPLIVKDLKNKIMKEPCEINLMEELNLLTVSQYYAFISENKKVQCINSLLKLLRINQCIIFCNSVSRVELLAKKILQLGFPKPVLKILFAYRIN